MCCKGLSATARGQDISDVITSYLKEMNWTWKSCVGICTDSHCFLHKEVLVSKISQEDLKQVLHQVLEIVNYISQHSRLLMHAEVRWLSEGQVLIRVHELHKEWIAFFDREKQGKFCGYLRYEFWLSKLEYLTEIFTHLNNTNSSMQGRNENILTSTDKLVTLKKWFLSWSPIWQRSMETSTIISITEHRKVWLDSKSHINVPSNIGLWRRRTGHHF